MLYVAAAIITLVWVSAGTVLIMTGHPYFGATALLVAALVGASHTVRGQA